MSVNVNEKNFVAVGPWGGQNGLHWDDGVFSSIRQIFITHGDGIDSIQIEYDKQGRSVWSEKHGGIGGYKTDKIKLAYPQEYLVAVCGFFGPLYRGGPVCIRSLTFDSNEKTYGPFGVEEGTSFTFPMVGGQIVGFYGRAGWYLDSIGAHVKPICHNKLQTNGIQYNQTQVAAGAQSYGYSVIQGSIADKYDVVFAIKQKDNHSNIHGNIHSNIHSQNNGSSPVTFTKRISSSSDSSDSDHKTKPKKKLAEIGAVGPPVPFGGHASYGPWGGTGGTFFDDGNVYTGIRQIFLSRNVGIVWIRALYDQNGKPVWGAKNGGTGGFKTEKIVLDYPGEILTHITGYYAPTMIYGPTVVRSLTFHTTKGKYGPYGDEHGVAFNSNIKEGAIVGFHGKKGLFLDAIGVHVKEGKVKPSPIVHPPLMPPVAAHPPLMSPPFAHPPPMHPPHPPMMPLPVAHPPPMHPPRTPPVAHPPLMHPPVAHSPHLQHGGADKHTTHGDNRLVLSNGPLHKPLNYEEGTRQVVKEPAPCGPGPWGGDGGKPWDDGVYMGIREIFVTRSEVICSIQIEYDRNGQSVWSAKHGASSGKHTHRVKLDYPNEVLTCISGYYSPLGMDHNTKVIRSLTFYTSRGKFGPFGDEVGTFFTSMTTEGKVVGFHGRSGQYLDAIGVHMQHWLGGHNKHGKSSFLKMFG